MAYNSIKKLLEHEKPWEYSFDLEWEKGGYDSIKDPLERYFIYKSTDPDLVDSAYDEGKSYTMNNLEKYGEIPDPDGFGGDVALSTELYEKLWGRKNDIFGNVVFGGDTMNSVQTTLNELLEVPELSEYHNVERKGNNSIRYCLQLFSKYDKDDTKKEKIFKKLCDKYVNLKEYISSYHTMGNFVLVPAGFNEYRGDGKTDKSSKKEKPSIFDFWDSSLVHLKKYGFGTKFKREYFTRYINCFFLWDYVEAVKGEDGKTEYRVKPLFKSHEKIEEGENLEESKANWTNITVAEANGFMGEVITLNENRGMFMTALLRLRTSEELKDVSDRYFKYIQGEEFLSAVHENGFKKAVNKLFDLLDGIKNNDTNAAVKKIRADLDEFLIDSIPIKRRREIDAVLRKTEEEIKKNAVKTVSMEEFKKHVEQMKAKLLRDDET